LSNHQILLFLLLPLVFITSFDTFIKIILNGFNLFRISLVFLLIKSVVNLTPLIFYFLTTRSIEIEVVALINLFSALGPLILEILILLLHFPKRVSDPGKGISFKSFIKKVLKYGSILRIQGFMGELWVQGQTQAISVYESPEWVTGYNLSRNYNRISGLFLNALNAPLLYSFSSLDYKQHYKKIIGMYKNVFYYSLFLFLIISGVLILLSDFFMGFVFGEDYIVYSILNKLTLISGVISIYASLYLILLRTTYRIKQQIYILVIGFPAQIILFFIGIVNFGIVGVLVIDIMFRIVTLSIICFVSIKVMKVDVNLLKILIFYGSFFFSIALSSFLDNLILKDLSFQFWELLNLSLFNQLNFLNVLVFLILFLLLNIIFKTFTKTDLEYIERVFSRDKISHNAIRRFLHLFKRFLR
jgi:O-antigen/teichoic acid export membrane protein